MKTYKIQVSGQWLSKIFSDGTSCTDVVEDQLPDGAELYNVKYDSFYNTVNLFFKEPDETVELTPVFKQKWQ